MTPAESRQRIAALAGESANVVLSLHAKSRMRKRNITLLALHDAALRGRRGRERNRGDPRFDIGHRDRVLTRASDMYHYTECGLPNVWLVNGYGMQRTPYGDGVAIRNLDGLHRVIARRLVRLPRTLAGREFRFLRKELELSQENLADDLGCNVQALARWEKGKSRLAKPAERLLRLLYREADEGVTAIRALIERIGSRGAAEHARMEFERTRGRWKAAA